MSKTSKYPPRGFTLIELLVVVLIIGILAAIALPQYRLVMLKSKYATMMDIGRVVSEAEERYFMVHNDYTTDFNDLDISYSGIYGETNSLLSIPNGHCSLAWHRKEAVVCILDIVHPKLIYTVTFSNSSWWPNVRFCRVYENEEGITDTLQDRVCKDFTKKDTPIYSYGNIYYF